VVTGGSRGIGAALADVTNPDALLALRTQTERRLGPVELVAAVAGGQGRTRAARGQPGPARDNTDNHQQRDRTPGTSTRAERRSW
jgi:NAD(P)-dependent dehydrogenase (short-subunit alcohol dehydrogenase family)